MKHLLIVDDDKTNLTMARNALSDVYKITAVLSGEQALRFLNANIPDLILLDISRIYYDNNLNILFDLNQHSDLTVSLKARKNPHRMIIVKKLSAEF